VAALERSLASRWAARGLDVVLASALAERAVLTAIEGPLPDVAVRAAIRAGIFGRVAGDLLESGAAEQMADRILAGPELDAALASPRVAELAERIAHQGAGFADQLAGELGQRSRRADARLERVARRLLRRSPASVDIPDTVAHPGPP
jgi:hypothetical protein